MVSLKDRKSILGNKTDVEDRESLGDLKTVSHEAALLCVRWIELNEKLLAFEIAVKGRARTRGIAQDLSPTDTAGRSPRLTSGGKAVA